MGFGLVVVWPFASGCPDRPNVEIIALESQDIEATALAAKSYHRRAPSGEGVTMENEYLRRIAEALERIANHLDTGPAVGSEVLTATSA